jgi:hypothetical protein
MVFGEDYIKDVEIEFLRIVAKLLENGDFEIVDARTCAQFFLSLSPFQTVEDLRNKLQQLSSKYPDFKELEVYEMGKSEEAKTDEVLEKMRGLMKNGEIDEALQLTQQQ